uniref:Uncharacterized protein n=1 Tax=Stegastes partitus TaxID=144197 RepID=A0A3B4ZHM0_9TELE
SSPGWRLINGSTPPPCGRTAGPRSIAPAAAAESRDRQGGSKMVAISDRKELDGARKETEKIEKSFRILAANNQGIIEFMEEHKKENAQLKLENEQLQKENQSLFSQKLHDKEVPFIYIQTGVKYRRNKEKSSSWRRDGKKRKQPGSKHRSGTLRPSNVSVALASVTSKTCLSLTFCRFELEAEAVNADVRVTSLQSALDESTTKFEKLNRVC